MKYPKLILLASVAVVMAATEVAAQIVEWEFPRMGSCHEGLPFSDGVTGVLVWGGDETLNLTIGRADLWDHRGGYEWTTEQNYRNIVRLVQENREQELLALFRKETPKGEPRNPYMLPLGRVIVKLKGARLVKGELDPLTGEGRLLLDKGGAIELAMSKQSRAFAMKFPAGVEYEVVSRPAWEVMRPQLEELGFKAPVKRADGFDWELPADPSVSLTFAQQKNELFLATARSKVAKLATMDFAQVAREAREYWAAFWAEGARVSVPDRLLQQQFEYGMYRFGAMTDPDGVPAGLQGPWLEDDKFVPWSGDYHFNINVQECYAPAFRGGHFRNLLPMLKMVLSWRPRLRDNAQKFCGIDNGYVLPHSVDDRGVCIGGFWTGTIDHGSTAWMASYMFRYVKYSGDREFLKAGAYDFMKGAMNVYRAMMEEYQGRLSIPVAPSPEFGGASFHEAVGRDPSFQLACAHRLARDLIDAAKMLGEQPDPMWLDVERRLPLFAISEKDTPWSKIGLFEGVSLPYSHRHHSHMAGLYPFDVIDFEKEPIRNIVVQTYNGWIIAGTGQWSGWCVPWASILHTHVGNAERAVDLLHDWDRYFCNPGHGSRHNAYLPGFSTMGRNGFGERGDANFGEIMQMDGASAACTAVMELLAHEVNGETKYFLGCPSAWKEVSFSNLAMSDGTRKTLRRK